MKIYDLSWIDGNGPYWEFQDSWYSEWYVPRACGDCFQLDLRWGTEIEFVAKSIPATRNMIDVVGKRVSLAIVHAELYRAIQDPFDQAFYTGPVMIEGKPHPDYIACIARYESRVLFEGSIATEDLGSCRGCGRRFQNVIGQWTVEKADLAGRSVVSDCAGFTPIISEEMLRALPKHVLKKCPLRSIRVKD